jgi:hypothetical protein
MIEIKSLNLENFNDFLFLLKQRGEAPEDYYAWKYLQQPLNYFPAGYIAYYNHTPVGCIGIINKIYIDEDGKEHPATWFADWYVSKNAQGKGIGKVLMDKVYSLSPYAFGIPGPLTAQIVAEKVGYLKADNFFELQFPINTLNTCFKKNSNLIKAFLKYLIFKFESFCFNFKIKNGQIKIVNEKPTVEFWLNEICGNKKSGFSRNEDLIKWFLNLKTNKDREWWYCKFNDNFAVGYKETNYWNLKQTKIVEFISKDEDFLVFFKSLKNELYRNKVDIGYMLLTKNEMEFPKKWIINIPVFSNHKLNTPIEYISLIDKESSWHDFFYY